MNDRHIGFGNRYGAVLKRKIFVGGVNPALGHDVLETYFGKYGPIENATIMRYSDGRSRGFGFVVFRDETACQQALQQRNHAITPQDKVEVKPCLSRAKTRPSGSMSSGVPGGMMGGPPGASYGGCRPRQLEGGYGHAPYRGGEFLDGSIGNNGSLAPYGIAYDGHEYSGYTRGPRPGEAANVVSCNGYNGGAGNGAYGVAPIPGSDYVGYNAAGSGTFPTQTAGRSAAMPHAPRGWGSGYRDDGHSEYWRDPYDPSYGNAEYYGSEAPTYTSSGAAASGSVGGGNNQTVPLMQRNASHPYPPTLPASTASVVPNMALGVQSPPPRVNRDGYYDMGSFGGNDGRFTTYGGSGNAQSSTGANALRRVPSVAGSGTGPAGSAPLVMSKVQSGVIDGGGHPGYAPLRRSGETSSAYVVPGPSAGGYAGANSYGRAAPY